MSIVRMKKLRLVAMAGDRGRLLKRLQRQGCVEIGEFDRPPESLTAANAGLEARMRLKELSEMRKKAEEALKVLKKYAYKKSALFAPLPEISEKDFFADYEAGKAFDSVRRVLAEEARLNALQNEKHTLEAFISSLKLWQDVEIPLQLRQTESSHVILGAIPAARSLEDFREALACCDEETHVSPAGCDRDLRGLVLICSKRAYPRLEKALKDFNFTRIPAGERTGTAAENIGEAEKSLLVVELQIEDSRNRLSGLGSLRDEIRLFSDRLAQEIAEAEADGRLIGSEAVFALQGWVSEPDVGALTELLEGFDCAYELTDPEEGEKVPVRLCNNALTRPLNMVTEMYSLPAYEGVDPNPLIMPFFTIFFGMMFNDLGYGLALVAASLFLRRKAKPRGALKYMTGLMLLCGISAAVFGIITGSFFGDSIPVVAGMYGKTAAMPALLNP